MREVERLCDRIAILYRGHLLAEGSLGELREQHNEQDLEELFFGLISQHDKQRNEIELAAFCANAPHFIDTPQSSNTDTLHDSL
jgi:sodium transport system ATP-binding protein